MHYQRMTKEEQYQDIVKTIVQESAYKRKASSERKYMSVHDMGDLLGIRKTDRYWLVHKGFFKTEIICGKMMVEIASFEKWYANQVKYHKVSGEEPGQELKKQSYSARDIAEILDIAEWKAYKIMNDAQVEFILVDYWKRYPKEAFDRWYQSQNVYQNSEDRKNNKKMNDDLITMPEMARLLGVDRHKVYQILKNEPGAFDIVYVDDRRHIVKESFYKWYEAQDKYRMASDRLIPSGIVEEEDAGMEVLKRKIYDRDNTGRNIGNKEYLTIREAAYLAQVDMATISKWLKKAYIPGVKSANVVRIPRQAFEQWLQERKEN